MLRAEFPQVQHYRLGTGRGPAFQRNRGIKLATQKIVFPVDDDTLFVSPRTVEQTLAEFDNPRVAAVGIPFVNVRQSVAVCQRAPDADRVYAVHAFVGAAHAVRRDVFLQSGGYREHFFYMGEEGDLCLRILAAGLVTRVGRADPVHHYESPLRNLKRAAFYGRRNDILFAWHNVPTLWLLPYFFGNTFNAVRWAFWEGRCWSMLVGTASGLRTCFKRADERAPVSARIYWLSRRLKRKGPLPLDNFEAELPGDGNTAC